MDKFETRLIEFIEGNLDPSGEEKVKSMIENDPGVLRRYTQLKEIYSVMDSTDKLAPTAKHEDVFNKHLQEEIDKRKVKSISFSFPYKIAASILLIVAGGAIAFWISKSIQQANELAVLRMEMENTKVLMFDLLANQNSASTRMSGVTVAYNLNRPDDQIINSLIQVLNGDQNTNVRLVALEALYKFYELPHVKAALIKSLPEQSDPTVQIMMIRMLVEMKEKEIINELKILGTKEDVLPAVKDEAFVGLLKLS